jgi:hypothetical protein
MLQRSLIGALLLVLGMGSFALTKPAARSSANDNDAKRIGELIGQLGSSKFQERSAAQKELETIGAPALEQLKALKTTDLETSKRAAELVRKMEEKIFTAGLLAPKRVHLKVKDMPVLDAVNELAKLSGYPIQVLGDRTNLAEKKITLDTGDVTFWEAFDKLCTRAGLVEQVQAAVPTGRMNERIFILPGGGRNNLPGGILPVVPPKNGKPGPDLKPDEKNNVKPVGAQAGGNIKLEAAAPVIVAQVQLAQLQVQPAQIQIQVQAQPIQLQPLQPFQLQPFGAQPPPSQAGITVVPGTPKNQHVSYAGSVRARVYASSGGKAGEYRLTLEASAEPRLQGFAIAGTPTVEKAIDDQDQKLLLNTESVQANAPPVVAPAVARLGMINGTALTVPQREIILRFKAGEKPAKSLKELSGSFTAQVVAPPEALITIDNVLKAAGETVKGKSGGSLKLNSIAKLDNGDYKLQIYLENPPAPNANGGMIVGNAVIQQVQIQVGGFGGPAVLGNTNGLPELVDAKGNKFQAVQIPARRMNFNNGVSHQEVTIVFRGQAGQGDPDRLILHGSRTVNVTVPFAFQNVPVE